LAGGALLQFWGKAPDIQLPVPGLSGVGARVLCFQDRKRGRSVVFNGIGGSIG
jgi:hypothetical protein